MKPFTPLLRKCLAALGMLLLLSASAQAAAPIRVGSVLSITGPASYIGDPEAKTLKLYVDQINASGGVLGRPPMLAPCLSPPPS